MLERTTIYVMSPESEQGVALRRLCTSVPGYEVVGVRSVGTSRAAKRHHNTVTLQEALLKPDAVVIPTGVESTREILSRGDHRVGTVSLTSSMLDVADKKWILARASEAAVPVPDTWFDPRQIPASSFPIFYKEDTEVGGGRRGVSRSRHDVPIGPGLIYQELIHSPGTYGVSFIARDGHPTVLHSHYERHSFPATGGSAVQIEDFASARLAELTVGLLKQLRYTGWGLAEYKYCPRRDDYVLMEINGKLWASCEFTFRRCRSFLTEMIGCPGLDAVEGRSASSHIFFHRLLGLGPRAALRPLLRLPGSSASIYPGWPRLLLIGLAPAKGRRLLSKCRAGRSGAQ